MKKVVLFLTISVLVFVLADDIAAQCAMCKAAPTTSLQGGSKKGAGLNSGILYLMSIPYFALIGLVFLFFRKQITTRVKQMWE